MPKDYEFFHEFFSELSRPHQNRQKPIVTNVIRSQIGCKVNCSQNAFMDKAIYSRQGACLREMLIELRKNAGLTQRQLAEKLNREHNLVGRLEVGERRLDLVNFFGSAKPVTPSPKL
jgi:ribosome-binding protein aMBF1 (putative translation factor)